MAYTAGFSGRTESLPYIVKTLESKLYAIPGTTCNPDLSIMANAEGIEYFTQQASSVSEGKIGQQHTWDNVYGVDAQKVLFDDCVKIDRPIPGAAKDTVSADVVNSALILETTKVANRLNEKFITAVEGAANKKYTAGVSASYTVTSTYSADDVYGSLLALRAEFVAQNKDSMLKPQAIFVSPAVYSALLKANLIFFKDGLQFGTFSDMAIIECPDLSAGTNAVMLNSVAVFDAENVRYINVLDGAFARLPGGSLIVAEIGAVRGECKVGKDFNGVLVLKF